MTEKNEMAGGGFDAERAKKMAGEVAGEFRRKLKWAQRWMLAELLIFGAAMVFFMVRFLEAGTEMEWILFGVLFLMAYETTVLIKMWYFVVNTKISVIRELKQFRLASAPASQAGVAETPKTVRGISRWEWLGWIAVWATAVGLICNTYRGPRMSAGGTGLEQYVVLAADGSGKVTTKVSTTGTFMPQEAFTVHFTGKDVEHVRWYDAQWHEMASEMREVNGERVYTVHWPHPMLPTERRTYYQVLERAGLATKAGGVWTYEGEWPGFWPPAQWSVTVRMPPGATVVEASPQPTMRG